MRTLLAIALFLIIHSNVGGQAQAKTILTPLSVTDTSLSGSQDRVYWVKLMQKIVSPVIYHLADETLKKEMPVVESPTYDSGFHSHNVAYLEAVGRTLAGIAPWLSLPDDTTAEGKLRKELRKQVLKGLVNMVNPKSPDYLNFRTQNQPLVDAAYVAQAFMQARQQLWEPLDSLTKQRFITEFKALRRIKTIYNNWLLFSGMVETFLLSVNEQYDPFRIDIAWRKLKEWYVGDGWYKDGNSFAMDYYNSYVMHPMMVLMLKELVQKKILPSDEYEQAMQRMVRYSEFLERMISPEGYYPPFGRSITYRIGIFHALEQTALMHQLPPAIQPAQVRCGITAVMKNQFEHISNFDEKGWLLLGFVGHQPNIADYYTCTGSLYICSLGFIALGLPGDDEFWKAKPAEWTSKQAWGGKPFKKDYHVEY